MQQESLRIQKAILDVPSSSPERRTILSIGVSTSNWAPTKRKGKVNANTANKRNMRFRGWVSSVVNRRFAPTGERPALSPDLVAGILIEGRRRGAMDGKGHVQPEIKDTAEDAVVSLNGWDKKLSTTNTNQLDSIKLSPAALISKIASEIDAEVPEISFDYFTMHNTA